MKYSWSGRISSNRLPKAAQHNKKVECIASEVGSGQQSQLPQHQNYPLKSSFHHSKEHYSFKKDIVTNRKNTNTASEVSNLHEDYYHEMEQSLKLENSNLNQHNAFLIGQIKTLFERQKKYKKAILASREKIKKLESLNQHLQSQLMMLTSSIVAEIERMQRLIENERSVLDEQMNSATSDFRKSLEGIGSETEITLNHNLEALKQRVSNLCNENFSRTTTDCQHSANFQSFSLDSKASNEIGEKVQQLTETPVGFDKFNNKSKGNLNQFETFNIKKQQVSQNRRTSIKKI